MNEEGLTSIAVVDNAQNVVGNISTKDVRHLTSTSDAPLLNSSCMHFISVILSERGREAGRDAVPVFYVSRSSTLAHTVAKLVATNSHRMWVVEQPAPSSSGTLIVGSPGGGPPASPTVPASALAGTNMSGRLVGVVSLTDILNIFAKSTGLHPGDPGDQRAMRRRSSSSSQRPSIDAGNGGSSSRR
jgi:CBS domain-containing protein